MTQEVRNEKDSSWQQAKQTQLYSNLLQPSPGLKVRTFGNSGVSKTRNPNSVSAVSQDGIQLQLYSSVVWRNCLEVEECQYQKFCWNLCSNVVFKVNISFTNRYTQLALKCEHWPQTWDRQQCLWLLRWWCKELGHPAGAHCLHLSSAFCNKHKLSFFIFLAWDLF